MYIAEGTPCRCGLVPVDKGLLFCGTLLLDPPVPLFKPCVLVLNECTALGWTVAALYLTVLGECVRVDGRDAVGRLRMFVVTPAILLLAAVLAPLSPPGAPPWLFLPVVLAALLLTVCEVGGFILFPECEFAAVFEITTLGVALLVTVIEGLCPRNVVSCTG